MNAFCAYQRMLSLSWRDEFRTKCSSDSKASNCNGENRQNRPFKNLKYRSKLSAYASTAIAFKIYNLTLK